MTAVPICEDASLIYSEPTEDEKIKLREMLNMSTFLGAAGKAINTYWLEIHEFEFSVALTTSAYERLIILMKEDLESEKLGDF